MSTLPKLKGASNTGTSIVAEPAAGCTLVEFSTDVPQDGHKAAFAALLLMGLVASGPELQALSASQSCCSAGCRPSVEHDAFVGDGGTCGGDKCCTLTGVQGRRMDCCCPLAGEWDLQA
mmetsp:Transcript_148748/g.414414  ORF Transcript_148748/g.414414 Transcript_148748/m.414414 type:complete len:119 (+) Transcript_148748:1923-2279(+)